MNKTTIEWTDYTWNPVTGCSKVSQGCKNCYAETLAKRFWGDRKFTDVQVHEDRLMEVKQSGRKWANKKVFVCSMSDLFHDDVAFEFIDKIYDEMCWYTLTTFQILTKRPARVLRYMEWRKNTVGKFRLPDNVWIGTSCEDQATADERIPLLLQIPAAVHFLSCEPLIGPLDVSNYLPIMEQAPGNREINWVIVGGESGHGARPMHPDWVRSLRDQCRAANVPFFFKQWGEWSTEKIFPKKRKNIAGTYLTSNGHRCGFESLMMMMGKPYETLYKSGKNNTGNLLDGRQHLEFPEPINQQLVTSNP